MTSHKLTSYNVNYHGRVKARAVSLLLVGPGERMEGEKGIMTSPSSETNPGSIRYGKVHAYSKKSLSLSIRIHSGNFD